MTTQLLRKRKPVRTKAPSSVTIRDFDGGLNVAQNDLTLSLEYAVILDNMFRGIGGDHVKRYGTKLRAITDTYVTGDIVELLYFADHLIVPTTTGQIAKVNNSYTVTAIWNTTIAAALPGSPSAWSTTNHIDYTEFKGNLILMNGSDKPLIIDDTPDVDYLQDPATGSNTNTPIAKYCTTVGNYVVMAAVTGASASVIYVSSTGTSGVWPGDSAPNDSTTFELGSYVPEGSSTIRGLSSFDNKLFVHFERCTISVQLGTFDGSGNHTPAVVRTYQTNGVTSHRCIVPLINDLVFFDERGCYTARQNTLSTAVEVRPRSDAITPIFNQRSPRTDANRAKAFAVHNQLDSRIMYFVPDGDDKYGICASYNHNMKRIAWSTLSNMNFTCGCASELGRVYFATGKEIYQYGNGAYADEDYYGDLMGSFDSAWTTSTSYSVGDRVLQNNTVYIVLVDHTSGTLVDDIAAGLLEVWNGFAVPFVWELPWTDARDRTRTKLLQFLATDTTGTSQFTFSVFVDRFYRDKLNNDLIPILSLGFVGGDSPGFGGGAQPFGGGRRALDERLWGTPTKFKLIKFRFEGETTDPLGISSISVMFNRGGVLR